MNIKSAPKTIVIVRCVELGARERELIKQIKAANPHWPIIAVTDTIHRVPNKPNTIESDADKMLELDADFVKSSGLHFYLNKTGWMCGDYVIYKALELDWDFAWVIEPDVYFLNGAEDILSRLQVFDHDLLATHMWIAGDGWLGTGILKEIRPDLTVHAMAFPLLRISRRAAEWSLSLRRSITEKLDPGTKVPNDEAIVGTAVYNNSGTMLDIRRLYEEHFALWSTLDRVSIEDVSQQSTAPMIVHSGQRKEKFVKQMLGYWKGAVDGSDFCARQLGRSLGTASKQTLLELITDILELERS